MTGAFSATATAFIVLQFAAKLDSFEWILWIAPTLLLTEFAKREVSRIGV